MISSAGTIHFFFEGYFAFNHARMVTMTDFFGQSWKEYGLGDSRYMTSDSFTLCMETVTAVCQIFCSPWEDSHCVELDLLGPFVVSHRLLHHIRFPVPTPAPSTRIDRAIVWGCALLCDKHVHRVVRGRSILPTRTVLLLDILPLHERFLGCDTYW